MKDLLEIIQFEGTPLRRVWYKDEWWFSIVDVCDLLTQSKNPNSYWRKLKQRMQKESGQPVTNCHGLKLLAKDGKLRKTDCSNTEGVLRIVQSIPSPKAELFKQWLAKVGYDRIKEIDDPTLALERIKNYYRLKGYTERWIDIRLESVGIREKLTSEWKKRGVKEGYEYAILTAEISQATFGLKPSDYKKLKGLRNENLRDHMTDEELIFTMLGETGTRREAQKSDALGFEQNRTAAQKGGRAAGKARLAYEQETGKSIVSKSNFLKQIKEAVSKKLGGK